MKTRKFPGGVPQQDGVSRREFNASMLALGLSGAAVVSLSSTSSLAATPKKGGTFRVGIGAGETADSLDAATSSNEMVQVLGWSLRNNLVEIDHEGNAIPELVVDWEANSDATAWTFKLRPGVEFHNGKTLNVDDVLVVQFELSVSPCVGLDGFEIRLKFAAAKHTNLMRASECLTRPAWNADQFEQNGLPAKLG